MTARVEHWKKYLLVKEFLIYTSPIFSPESNLSRAENIDFRNLLKTFAAFGDIRHINVENFSLVH